MRVYTDLPNRSSTHPFMCIVIKVCIVTIQKRARGCLRVRNLQRCVRELVASEHGAYSGENRGAIKARGARRLNGLFHAPLIGWPIRLTRKIKLKKFWVQTDDISSLKVD